MSMRRYAVMLASATVAAVSGVGIAAAAGGGGASSTTPNTPSTPTTTQPRADPPPGTGASPAPQRDGRDGLHGTLGLPDLSAAPRRRGPGAAGRGPPRRAAPSSHDGDEIAAAGW